MTYQNYHRHSYFSNIITPDSVVSNEDYAKRAVELGHQLLSGVEHGWVGRYAENYELAEKYNLKFVFGLESYLVKNRFEKDKTNAHIILLAKNENGRQAINDIISEANLTGYYYRARIDLPLLLSLPKNDVWCTTACIAGIWKYEDSEDIAIQISKHFGNSFFLEVQNHNTPEQIALNSKIINLANKNNINTIFGCDSHIIISEQAKDREDYLLSKKIFYGDEQGWNLDYPTDEVAYQRFVDQGVLNKQQIKEAMENTNIFLDVEKYDGNIFNKEIKMPTLYPDKSQEEKDSIFIDEVWKEWNKEKTNVPKNKWSHYEEEINKEIDIVVATKHADYFLLNQKIITRGKELGGVITLTGRGSGVSFYINKLLGFTEVDRISSSVKMYPERFMSKTRILETKSLADFDMNLANPEIFAQAQKDILGEECSYPMISFGTMKPKAAFKMYARAKNIDFETANIISEQISKYEKDLKHADEEEKESVDILNYIEKKYHNIFLESKKYLGIVSDVKIAPCFSENTRILCNDGFKNIKDIAVGDYVITHLNRYRKVQKVLKNKSDDLYNINSFGLPIIATGNHPFFAIKYGWKGNKKFFESPQWKRVDELTSQYKIGCPINNESIIPEHKNLPLDKMEFWWIIGKYIADGWCHQKKSNQSDRRIYICCEKKDQEVKEIEEKLKGLFHYYISEERTTYRFVICDKNLFYYLQQFGNGAYNKHLTNDIINLPNSLLDEFLKGYLTSDGCINKTGETIFSTVSLDLAYGIQACVHKAYRLPCTFSIKKPRIDKIEGRFINCKKRYCGRIQRNGLNKLKRNFEKDNIIWYHIKDIKKEKGKGIDVYNLEVEEDHTYCAGGHIVHNCGYLVYSGNIRKEIGLIRLNSANGAQHVCAIIDGLWAENFKFLKNDLLKVSVVELIDKIYKHIGIKPHTVDQLLDICKNNKAVWNVYKNGWTMGINQVEKHGTRSRASKYAPQNISELSAFVAAVRPGFASMYKIFESREYFEYGIKSFDELIQTPELPMSFVLYQEQSMATLNYAGIPMTECYEIIKNIAKKRVEKVLKYKEIFINGFTKKIMKDEKKTTKEAKELSDKTWKILEDSSNYSFNSSHSYCVALDSLYGAYLKSHYPLIFYEIFMKILEEGGDKDRLSDTKNEAEKAYHIVFPKFSFGQDNRNIVCNQKTNEITSSLKSIKGFGNDIGNKMFDLYNNFSGDNFVDILVFAEESSVLSSKFESLIKIDYFNEFGNNKKLLDIYNEFKNGQYQYHKTLQNTTKEKRIIELKKIFENMPNVRMPIIEQIINEEDILGNIQVTIPDINKRYIYITSLDTKFAPRIQVYCLANGKQRSLKIYRKTYENNIFLAGDILYCNDFEEKKPIKFIDGEYVETEGETQWWLTRYTIVTPNQFNKILEEKDKSIDKK